MYPCLSIFSLQMYCTASSCQFAYVKWTWFVLQNLLFLNAFHITQWFTWIQSLHNHFLPFITYAVIYAHICLFVHPDVTFIDDESAKNSSKLCSSFEKWLLALLEHPGGTHERQSLQLTSDCQCNRWWTSRIIMDAHVSPGVIKQRGTKLYDVDMRASPALQLNGFLLFSIVESTLETTPTLHRRSLHFGTIRVSSWGYESQRSSLNL